jgi:predicted nucleic acid-binding protein
VSTVIDASVALKWVLDEADGDAALELRRERLIAPVLWLAEAANALWRRVRMGELAAAGASARLAELYEAPVTSVPIEPLLDRALDVAITIRHPIYDCLYLALALQNDTYVVTADRRFAAIALPPEFEGRVRLLGS